MAVGRLRITSQAAGSSSEACIACVGGHGFRAAVPRGQEQRQRQQEQEGKESNGHAACVDQSPRAERTAEQSAEQRSLP